MHTESLVIVVHKQKLNLSMRQLTHECHKHNCYEEIEAKCPQQVTRHGKDSSLKCQATICRQLRHKASQLHVPCFSQALDFGMLVCRANAGQAHADSACQHSPHRSQGLLRLLL